MCVVVAQLEFLTLSVWLFTCYIPAVLTVTLDFRPDSLTNWLEFFKIMECASDICIHFSGPTHFKRGSVLGWPINPELVSSRIISCGDWNSLRICLKLTVGLYECICTYCMCCMVWGDGMGVLGIKPYYQWVIWQCLWQTMLQWLKLVLSDSAFFIIMIVT